MLIRTAIVFGVLLSGLNIASAGQAAGQFRPRISLTSEVIRGRAVAVVTINDHPALTIRSAEREVAASRAQIIADRLDKLIASGLQPSHVVAMPFGKGLWGVKANGQPLLTATRAEASAQGVSSATLAHRWTQSIRALLAEPPLTLSHNHLTIPLGQTRTVFIGGAALAEDIVARDTNGQITYSRFNPDRRILTIQGVNPGKTYLSIQTMIGDNTIATTLPVDVMKYAARILPKVTVGVTGLPTATRETLRHAYYLGLGRAINAEPEASLELPGTPGFMQSLAPGAGASITIPMRLAGSGLLPVLSTTTVSIFNQTLTMRPATALYYCNNPEQVTKPSILFIGKMHPFKPIRLDYHHQNTSGKPLYFHSDLINTSDIPISVQIIAGIADSAIDTVQIGRRAGAEFLHELESNSGIIQVVPSHSRQPLLSQRFVDGLTVSGLMQIQQIDGGDNALTIEDSADQSDTTDQPIVRLAVRTIGDGNITPSRAVGLTDTDLAYVSGDVSPYQFADPAVQLQGTYQVNAKWVYLRIGHDEELRTAHGDEVLWGNYGVDYQIQFTLTNPTTEKRDVGLFFAPEAGSAAGVFQLENGPILEFDPTSPPDEKILTRLTLDPGQTSVVHLRTIPLNGSSYPIAIIAHVL